MPNTAEYAIIRDKMMKRQVLEEFVKALSPVRLPKTLWIYVDECQGGPNGSPYYSSGNRALVMCYQFMKVVEQRADLITQAEAKNPKQFPMRVSRDGFIAGVFAGVMLHEAGHALFDILDVPTSVARRTRRTKSRRSSRCNSRGGSPISWSPPTPTSAKRSPTRPPERPTPRTPIIPRTRRSSSSPIRSALSPTCTEPGASVSSTRCA